MPIPAEFEFRKSVSTNSIGDDIDLTAGGLIVSDTELNLFRTGTTAECTSGSTIYRIFYVKYIGTQTAKTCAIALLQDTLESFTKVSWAFDPSPHKYIFAPSQSFNGTSDFIDVADAPSLDLLKFTVSVWFKTSKDYTAGEGALVNKGGYGSATAGENLNYGIRITTANKINAGFETAADVKWNVDSSTTLNDGKWHLAVVTYDQINVKLYIDGVAQTPTATTATPETNAKPLTLGKNSRAADRYFDGSLDEVRVWNRDWTAAEVTDYYNNGLVPNDDDTAEVYKNKFGDDNNSVIAQKLTNETTAPAGSPTWFNATSLVPDPPNIGDMPTNRYIPIIVRWVNLANTPPIENDKATLNVYFGTQSGQSGGGGDGGGSPPPSNSAMKIASTGDSDCKSKTDEVVSMIKTNLNATVNVFVHTGDLAYSCSKCIFGNLKPIDDVQGSTIRTEVCFGNHDDGESECSSNKNNYMNHWGLSKSYYSFEVENVHFLMMDTQISFSAGSAQHTFVNSDLTAARNNPNIDWIVVVFHKPLFGASSKHPYNEGSKTTIYMPIFDQYKVDLILQGHNHNYQRTHQVVTNSSTPTSPKKVGSSSPYTGGVGRISIIAGTGGHDSGSGLYSLGSQPSYQAFQDNSVNGAVIMTLSNNNKTMTVEYRDTDNHVVDSFVINR